jgi:tol-pal system protein YbgF
MKKFVLIGAMVLGGCATAGEVDSLRTRVTLLESRLADAENRNKTAHQAAAEKAEVDNKALRRDLAMVGARQDAIQQRVQVLEGRTEEVQTSAGKMNFNALRLVQIEEEQLKIKDQSSQLDMRLAAMEKVLTQGAPAPAKSFDDEAAYKVALAKHNAGEYKGSRELFEKMLREKPDSKLASNAVFWLGEGFYKEKSYEEALRRYTNVVEKYPDSNKRCSSLLKIAIVLEELGEKQKAQPFYAEVTKSCADTPEAQEAAKRQK